MIERWKLDQNTEDASTNTWQPSMDVTLEQSQQYNPFHVNKEPLAPSIQNGTKKTRPASHENMIFQ